MMVVVAIIALVSAMALPSITSYFKVSLTSASRELAGTIKEAYNATVVTGKVHRLVYDFKDSTYWVESGPAGVLLDTKESKQREERMKRPSDKKDEETASSRFQLDKSVTRKKQRLPAGVSFEDVVTQQSDEPLSEGQAYTHFFPHGLAEQTIIHLKDNSKHQVSLIITPLLGKTEMYERYLTEAEAFAK